MVVSKRRTENERFSFTPNARIVDELEIQEPFSYTDFSVTSNVPVVPNTVQKALPPQQYVPHPKTAEYIGLKDRKNASRFVMPKIQRAAAPEITDQDRREIADKIARRNAAAPSESKSKIKLSLVLYMIVISILALTVLATGVAISGAASKVTNLEKLAAEKNQTIISQNYELDLSNNNTLITGLATEQDMEKITSYTEITLAPVVEVPAYSAITNWFDKLCDFFSKTF